MWNQEVWFDSFEPATAHNSSIPWPSHRKTSTTNNYLRCGRHHMVMARMSLTLACDQDVMDSWLIGLSTVRYTATAVHYTVTDGIRTSHILSICLLLRWLMAQHVCQYSHLTVDRYILLEYCAQPAVTDRTLNLIYCSKHRYILYFVLFERLPHGLCHLETGGLLREAQKLQHIRQVQGASYCYILHSRWKGYLHNAAVHWAHARWSFFLTSIRTLMVSGCRLARRKEIVSWPPEKTHSTATADPEDASVKINWHRLKDAPGIQRRSCANQKRFGNCAHPPMNRVAGLEIFGRKLEKLFKLV